jgi:hypothetical protein
MDWAQLTGKHHLDKGGEALLPKLGTFDEGKDTTFQCITQCVQRDEQNFEDRLLGAHHKMLMFIIIFVIMS